MDIKKLVSIYDRFIKTTSIHKTSLIDDPFFNEGLNLQSQKKYVEALQNYNNCKMYYPNHAILDLNIASVYEKMNKKNEYKEVIEQCIKNNLVSNYNSLAAFNTHPNLFLERHLMAEFIIKNKDEIQKRLNERLSDKINNQNKIFVFWDNPEKAPEIVKSAIESIKKNVGQDFDLIILNKENLEEYITLPDHIKNIMIKNPAHFSDWLRTKLLRKYGGVWLDATCYVTQNLSTSLFDIAKQECFFFTYKGSRVGSWFIYSNPNSYILNAIDIVMDLWWESEKYLTNYFMYHDIVEMLYWTDNEYKKHWDKMLKIHPNKALEMNKNLQNDFDLNLYNSISKNHFLHKLTYKVHSDSYNRNTFIKNISNDDSSLLLLINDLTYKYNFIEKVWVYNNKINVIEFHLDSLNFGLDIYKKDGKILVDFVPRDEFTKNKIISLSTEKHNICSVKNISEAYDRIFDFIELTKKNINKNIVFDVSVIITNFNRETLVLRALESLKNQKNENITYEVLIVDDNSTDNSLEKINLFIKNNKLSNFKVLSRIENSGTPSIPRNDGILASKGEYILFVDSDDYVDQNTIKNGYIFSKKNKSDITFIKLESKSGLRTGFGEQLFKNGNINNASFIENKLYRCPQVLNFFKKSFIIKNRLFFNPSHKKWEDLIFMSKALNSTDRFSILADQSYYYVEDFQNDNITFNNLNINEQNQIMLECHSYYLTNRNPDKYSGFINRLLVYITRHLKSNITIDQKFYIFNLFKNSMEYSLIKENLIDNRNDTVLLKLIISNDFFTSLKHLNAL